MTSHISDRGQVMISYYGINFKIHRGRVRKARIDPSRSISIEYYEKFLDLWRDADPGIVEVNDAKKRLAGLKSQ